MVLQELQEMVKTSISDPKFDWINVATEDLLLFQDQRAAAHSLVPVPLSGSASGTPAKVDTSLHVKCQYSDCNYTWMQATPRPIVYVYNSR
jgi:hypothetical protein